MSRIVRLLGDAIVWLFLLGFLVPLALIGKAVERMESWRTRRS